jgi:hypothetical protein
MGPLSGALGIFSPSRVTYGYGQDVGAGLALGISESASGVATAATGLADTVTDALTIEVPELDVPPIDMPTVAPLHLAFAPIDVPPIPAPDMPVVDVPEPDPLRLAFAPVDLSPVTAALSSVTDTLTSAFRVTDQPQIFGRELGFSLVRGLDETAAPLVAATRRLAGIVTNELGAVTSATVAGGIALPQVGGLGATVGEPLKLQATINTDDTSRHPPWALDWLAQANVELRYSGEP